MTFLSPPFLPNLVRIRSVVATPGVGDIYGSCDFFIIFIFYCFYLFTAPESANWLKRRSMTLFPVLKNLVISKTAWDRVKVIMKHFWETMSPFENPTVRTKHQCPCRRYQYDTISGLEINLVNSEIVRDGIIFTMEHYIRKTSQIPRTRTTHSASWRI